jgi:hypothetical protein
VHAAIIFLTVAMSAAMIGGHHHTITITTIR